MSFVGASSMVFERLAIAALLVLPTRTMVAQTEPTACASAARAARTAGVSAADISRLASCPVSGPEALQAAWQSATRLSDTGVEALIRSSRRNRDGRLYSAVSAIAADPSRATVLRLAALSVLASYYRPDMTPSVHWLRSARVGDPVPSASDAYSAAGLVSLPESRTTEFPRLLQELVQSGADSAVSSAALRMRQYIALTYPDDTPIPSGAVRLIAGCRNLLTLQSTLDVTIPLRVEVLGTSAVHTYSLKRWNNRQPVQLTLDLPPGTVVVTYGRGRELARLTNRSGPCAKSPT